MNNWLEKLLDVTAVGNNEATLKSALANLAERFDLIGYAFVGAAGKPMVSNTILNGRNLPWISVYRSGDAASSDQRPFAGRGNRENRILKQKSAPSLQTADFNIRSGVSIPVRTAGRYRC